MASFLPPSDPVVLDLIDAAQVLRMSPRRLARLVKAGLVPYVDLGDTEPRFLPADLRTWVEQHRRQPPEEVPHG